MAPEVIIGNYDPTTPDRWFLGVMLYQYAFGAVPSFCHQRTRLALYQAILNQERSGKTIQQTDQAWIIQSRCNDALAQDQGFWHLLNGLICHQSKRLDYQQVIDSSFTKQSLIH